MTDAEDNGGTLVQKDGALVSAGVLAALGVAVYAWRKGVVGEGEGLALLHHDDHDEEEPSARKRRSSGGSLLMATLETASHSLLPFAEAAAEEAGRWTAKNAPALIHDRLLPRFIDAFKAAA